MAARPAREGIRGRWRLTVRAPATCANLGPGFDALGLAFDGLENRLTVQPADQLAVRVWGEGSGRLRRLGRNRVQQAFEAAMAACGLAVPPVRLVCQNRIPVARGLGSSASAAVAGLVAGSALAGRMGAEPLSPEKLLAMAAEFEGHADNAAAALFGGLVAVVAAGDAHRWVRLDPAGLPLELAVVVPATRLATRRARRALPARVPFDDARFNVGRTALLVAALAAARDGARRPAGADPDAGTSDPLLLLGEATRDRLHQPYRGRLLPWLDQALEAGRAAGALGACLSGAGPSVLAFARPGEAGRVGEGVADAIRAAGIETRVFVGGIAAAGATAVWEG